MPLFKKEKIDNAIDKTKYYLKEFKGDSNILYVSGLDFLSLAVDDSSSIPYLETSYEEYLASVQELYNSCTEEQKDEIKEIILHIATESKKAKLKPIPKEKDNLEKNNFWGKVMLSFLEGFNVSIVEEIETV